VLAVALVVVAVLLGGLVLLRNRRGPGRDAPGPDGRELLSPDDVAEVAALLAQVEAEERHTRDSLLSSRLDVLVAREIPVRRVTPAAIQGAATVGFADGTAVTVASRKAAEAGVLLLQATRYRVLLRGYREEDGHLVLRFRRDGSGRDLEVVALGLDQPS